MEEGRSGGRKGVNQLQGLIAHLRHRTSAVELSSVRSRRRLPLAARRLSCHSGVSRSRLRVVVGRGALRVSCTESSSMGADESQAALAWGGVVAVAIDRGAGTPVESSVISLCLRGHEGPQGRPFFLHVSHLTTPRGRPPVLFGCASTIGRASRAASPVEHAGSEGSGATSG